MKRVFVILAAAIFSLGIGAVAVQAGIGQTPHHEEQDGCDHGHTGKACRPDPQPDHGKDCVKHGNHGGINEDHCKGGTVPSPSPTPTPTDSPKPTPTPTTSPVPSVGRSHRVGDTSPLAKTGVSWLITALIGGLLTLLGGTMLALAKSKTPIQKSRSL